MISAEEGPSEEEYMEEEEADTMETYEHIIQDEATKKIGKALDDNNTIAASKMHKLLKHLRHKRHNKK